MRRAGFGPAQVALSSGRMGSHYPNHWINAATGTKGTASQYKSDIFQGNEEDACRELSGLND